MMLGTEHERETLFGNPDETRNQSQSSATDVLALATMKNAAKCDR